eukprot:8700722-Pyramimonas_sp.AAC.2
MPSELEQQVTVPYSFDSLGTSLGPQMHIPPEMAEPTATAATSLRAQRRMRKSRSASGTCAGTPSTASTARPRNAATAAASPASGTFSSPPLPLSNIVGLLGLRRPPDDSRKLFVLIREGRSRPEFHWL